MLPLLALLVLPVDNIALQMVHSTCSGRKILTTCDYVIHRTNPKQVLVEYPVQIKSGNFRADAAIDAWKSKMRLGVLFRGTKRFMAGGSGSSSADMALPAEGEDHTQFQSHMTFSFVAHQKAQTCGSAQQRMQRRMVATASGVALLLLVAVLNLSSNTYSSRGAVELEMLKALEHSGSSSTAQSKGKTIDVATLVAEGQGKVKEEMKSLQDKAGKEEKKASELDKKVVTAESKLKQFVLKAKREQETGAESEAQAKEDVSRASQLRRKAEKLRDESEKARKEFVAQERPVEMATKLAAHDHHDYRKDELAVAQEVALLSEHPTDPKLRAKVDKLVKASKVAKGKMAEDQVLLTKLEKQTASARLGGTKGYTHLKAQSVHIAKSAEGLADDAVTLAKEGHTMKEKARKLVSKVEEEMKKPDELHAEAQQQRADYKAQMSKVAKLEQALHNMHDARLEQVSNAGQQSAEMWELRAARRAREVGREKDEVTGKGVTKEGGKQEHTKEEDSKNKYSGMRSELEREVGEKSSSSASKEADRLKVAKDSYDELEELEMKKEKAKLKEEREKKLTEGKDEGAVSAGDELKAAEKRAHILSAKQSTFLSGLFSNRAPWDTKRNVGE